MSHCPLVEVTSVMESSLASSSDGSRKIDCLRFGDAWRLEFAARVQPDPPPASPRQWGRKKSVEGRPAVSVCRQPATDWHDYLPWVLLGIRASFREDSEFSPAEAVFGSQLILPGQFVNTAESPSPSFLKDLQTAMAGRPPPPTWHNSAHAPSTLLEELLLARFVLVCRDGTQPLLSPVYKGPYRVLERSTHFFLLEMGVGVAPLRRRCLSAHRRLSMHRRRHCGGGRDR